MPFFYTGHPARATCHCTHGASLIAMEDYDGAVEQVRYHHHTSNVYIQYIHHSSFSRLNFRVKNDDDLPRQARDKRAQ